MKDVSGHEFLSEILTQLEHSNRSLKESQPVASRARSHTPMKVGLTGGIGSGKSLVSGLFAKLGVPIIDADVMAHALLKTPNSKNLQAIYQHFGNIVKQPNGELDRKRLRQIIFADNTQKDWLESLLHPQIRQKIQKALTKITNSYVILSIPLLIEKGYDTQVDTVLFIDAPEAIRIQRVCLRDHLPPHSVQQIIHTQATRSECIAKANDILNNDSTPEKIERAVWHLHLKYCTEANARSN